MLWPALTVVALLTSLLLHLWWRARFVRAGLAAHRQMELRNEEHEQTVSQLRTQQNALLDSMAEGLLLLDAAGRIQLANRAFARLFGSGADLPGKTLIEALRLHELAELTASLPAARQVLGYELRLPGPPERSIEVNAAAIIDANGQFSGCVLVFHDLTRLKKLERTREEFVANVSHELRTPLSLIKGYVETLLEGAIDNPEVAEKFLRTIDRNAERLKLLIEDLLTISELESGRLRLSCQPTPLNPVIDKVLADHQSRAAMKGVRLLNQAAVVTVQADADRIEQVFGNLVDNAIKYGKSGGQVVVGARVVDPALVEIVVKDDGPGIPPEALERVFERFYRLDKARSRAEGGTGLGLSIVKHIVQSHGGRVWVTSQPGQGAAFCFTLPSAPARPAT